MKADEWVNQYGYDQPVRDHFFVDEHCPHCDGKLYSDGVDYYCASLCCTVNGQPRIVVEDELH